MGDTSRESRGSRLTLRGLNLEDADASQLAITTTKTTSNRIFNLYEENPTGVCKTRSNKVITSRYTPITFIPLNAFEQFVYRPVNLYFLALVPLQIIPSISTSRGVPTVLNPLGFVLFVAALKDGIEDYRRHKSDRLENNRLTTICGEDGKPKKIRWSEVKVGQTVCIYNHELIPADVVLLDTSDEVGCAYVETANLDGETNLKVKSAPTKCMTYFDDRDSEAPEQSLARWGKITGEFECEEPNGSLYTFEGVLKAKSPTTTQVPFNTINVMLRGCKLRNTAWAVCKVVYTGKDTKIQRNSLQKTAKKITLVEKMTLRVLVCFFGLQCLLCTIGAAVSAMFETGDPLDNLHVYLNLNERGTEESGFFGVFVIRFLTFVLIFANFIPISLMVTMSMVKFGQAFFILYDKTMVHNEQNTIPRTSDLNEELGQVDFIFSDKTGTLTQNLMEFRRCFVGDLSYGKGLTEIRRQVLLRKGLHVPPEPVAPPGSKVTPCVNFIDEDLERHLKDPVKKVKLFEFFLNMAINHSVIVENVNDKISFSAASPDEGALVYGAKHFDFTFLDRQLTTLTVSCPGFEPFSVEVLVTIDFSSLRKRSSTIARFFHPLKQRTVIMLYTKGADNIIESRFSGETKSSAEWGKAKEGLAEYALDGLRTLVFAGRELSESEFDEWYDNYDSARNSVRDRSKKMELVAELIEMNLEFHAGTGIEDRLQDEVGETLRLLQLAGLKIWMLTGDKVETAINIGVATGLIEPGLPDDQMPVFDWDEFGREPLNAEEAIGHLVNRQENQADDSFDADGILKTFNKDGRMDISQEIVASIQLDDQGEAAKTRKREEACNAKFTEELARIQKDPTCVKNIVIDGASLACMLSRPHDFVALTKHSRSVLCCRVSPDQKGQVVRLMRKLANAVTLAIGDGANDCNMISSAHVGVGIRGEEGLQAFNVCDYGIAQFRFLQGLLLVHGRYAYRRIAIVVMYMFYKNILVVIPQFLLGFHSQFSGMRLYLDLMYQVYNIFFTSFPILVFGMMDQDTSRENCYKFPHLYKLGLQNHYLNWKSMFGYVCSGFWHSIVVYYIPYGALMANSGIVSADGKPADLWVVGTIIMLLEVIIANAKLVVECATLNKPAYFTYFLCIFFFSFLSLCINTNPGFPFGGFEAYGVTSRVFGMTISYITIILAIVVSLFPDVYYKICEFNYFPTLVHKLSLPPIAGKDPEAIS